MNPYTAIVRDALGDHRLGVYGQALLSCFAPRPRMAVSEWADQNRAIVSGPEPGPWSTSRVPFLREPMDACGDDNVTNIVLQFAAQLGKSSILENVIGFFMAADPSSIIYAGATEAMARDFSKERIGRMIADSPALAKLVSRVAKDADSTITTRQFAGGLLAVVWATSAAQLTSRAARVIAADELDRWPVETLGNDGDPWLQICARASTFGARKKIIAASTPTREGESRIAALYEDSDQRHFHVPCPFCKARQSLAWPNLVYKNERGEVDLENIFYECEACGSHILERHRPEMIAGGVWIPHNVGAAARGYKLSSLYSPFLTWQTLCEEWIRVTNARDKNGQREFYNLRLAEAWTEAAQPITVESLEKNREDFGNAEVPDAVRVLTVGVDTQDNRLELVIVGWGQHKESWGIGYAVVPGDTGDLTSPNSPWTMLDAVLARTWTKADGSGMTVSCTFIDSGGHRTDECFAFCRDRLARNIYPCHGRGGRGLPIVGKATLNSLRAPHYAVGVDTCKEALASRLQLASPGPGYIHFPTDVERGFDAEFFKGLLSERLTVKKGKRVWERTHRRNEPLDTAIYSMAAMEALLVTSPTLLDPAAPSAPAQPRRRIYSRGVE